MVITPNVFVWGQVDYYQDQSYTNYKYMNYEERLI